MSYFPYLLLIAAALLIAFPFRSVQHRKLQNWYLKDYVSELVGWILNAIFFILQFFFQGGPFFF